VLTGCHVYFATLSAGRIPRVPTWTPSPNISIRPTRIHTTVAIDKIGTNRKNAPLLPRNRAPEEARTTRIITNFHEQAGCQRFTLVTQSNTGNFGQSQRTDK
jgi:hypothetical protein